MKIQFEWLTLGFVALMAPVMCLAQEPSPEASFPPESPAARAPSLALAQEAAAAAVEACRARGLHVSASVVDSAGVLKVLLADDGADQRAVLSRHEGETDTLTLRRAILANLSDKTAGPFAGIADYWRQ
jgi:hypothetical protein